MLVPRFYEDLNVMHDKTMPARTYYIPASGNCSGCMADGWL